VVKLISLSPCAAFLPLTVGGVRLTEIIPERLVTVAPFQGQQDVVSAALRAQLGVGLSDVNRRAGVVTWFGQGLWMVAGDVVLDTAAVTDQTDAWAVVRIEGERVEDVLARLVPTDLRPNAFGDNHVAKTLSGHMPVTVVRTGRDAFDIMAMRSMAQTLVHDLEVAMRGVAARGSKF